MRTTRQDAEARRDTEAAAMLLQARIQAFSEGAHWGALQKRTPTLGQLGKEIGRRYPRTGVPRKRLTDGANISRVDLAATLAKLATRLLQDDPFLTIPMAFAAAARSLDKEGTEE